MWSRLLNWIPIFEWYTTTTTCKNGRRKETYCDEIGLCIDTIVSLTVNYVITLREE